MNNNLKQLALNLCLRDKTSFDNFFVGTNGRIVDALKNFYTDDNSCFIFLWGKYGSGKSHLLGALCQLFTDHDLTAAYLPMDEFKRLDSQFMVGLDKLDFLGIDDLNLIAGNLSWEEAIFNCFNRLIEQRKHIVITSNVAPSALALGLPDLKSRMTSDLIFEVAGLDDQEKIECIKSRAVLRGLELNDATVRFLLHNYSRDPRDLFVILDKLDKEALEHQRRLTIPFIKNILSRS